MGSLGTNSSLGIKHKTYNRLNFLVNQPIGSNNTSHMCVWSNLVISLLLQKKNYQNKLSPFSSFAMRLRPINKWWNRSTQAAMKSLHAESIQPLLVAKTEDHELSAGTTSWVSSLTRRSFAAFSSSSIGLSPPPIL